MNTDDLSSKGETIGEQCRRLGVALPLIAIGDTLGDSDGNPLSTAVYRSALEDAEVVDMIARAVNGHDALVGALQSCADTLQAFLDTFGDLGDRATQADLDDWYGALSLARGQTPGASNG